MADLHVQFMGIAGPTDVLTFELEHDSRGRCTAGEVVVCVPYAKRTAKQHGTTVERELLLYCLHGLLHLTGHDDRDDISYRKMHAAEDRILTAIGVGPVFAPPPGTPREGRDEGLSLRRRRSARKRSARR
jgi:probable rRNA maturation factor